MASVKKEESVTEMDRISAVYNRYRNFIECILFPVILILYPLLKTRQGIDVSDATYSLSNFQYFSSMDGTWMVATYLANVVGSLFMKFPFGDTLFGMHFYTTLIQSVAALGVYEAFRRGNALRIPVPLSFTGEMIALGMCWCPSTILYNYLTYLFMAVGMLLLYTGVLKENRKYYVAAGVCLGANVAVRMPNVVQMAFIVAVWYGAAVYRRSWQQVVRDTLWCILGYIVGFGVPFAVICIRYGAEAYPAMVQTMFAMTEKATDYKPTSMLTSMFGDYITGLFWIVFAMICMAGGWLLFALKRRLFGDKRVIQVLCQAIYVMVLLVLLRFYWGKGVFTFEYYDYGSMYYPAVLLLLVAVYISVYCLVSKKIGAEQKILAVLVLVQMFVTPLGSNNRLYPIINNMFILVPFVLGIGYSSGCKGHDKNYVWKIPFAILIIFVLIQSIGFHTFFAFQDGVNGEVRDTRVAAPTKAARVYTNRDNAAWLEELAVYAQQAELAGQEVILYGEIPGLGYLLDMPSALTTFWPDLDSYRMVEYERDMAQITVPPVVIVSSPIAAYLSEDADGMNWFGVKREKLDADEKLQILGEYLREHAYEETFSNGRYVVYVTGE